MFIFPVHLFNPSVIKAEPVTQTVDGGVSISGDEDFIATDGGGRWEVQYSGIVLNSPEKIRAWNAWQAFLVGGAQDVLVPLVSIATAPRASILGKPQPVPPIFADDDLFPSVLEYGSPVIVAALGAAAALRATRLKITVTEGGTLLPGQRFSIGKRAYELMNYDTVTDDDHWYIRPPLRWPVAPDYDEPYFDWPAVRCRHLPEDGPNEIADGRFGEVSIRFLERPPTADGDIDDEGLT